MSVRLRSSLLQLLPILLLGGCAWLTTGCHSPDKPAPTGFASVVIRSNTPGQIGDVAVEVFEEAGYTVVSRGVTKLVFEKQGTAVSKAAYGNWLGEGPLWYRVRVNIERTAEATFRLGCDAYRVNDRGQTLEEETKISPFQRGPYQKLLDEVARRLAPP